MIKNKDTSNLGLPSKHSMISVSDFRIRVKLICIYNQTMDTLPFIQTKLDQ